MMTFQKNPSKKERAFTFIALQPHGVTENEIRFNCHVASGRNYPTQLERLLDFRFHRTKRPNPDGIGTHTCYRLTDAESARKVLAHIDSLRERRKAPRLTEQFKETVLSAHRYLEAIQT